MLTKQEFEQLETAINKLKKPKEILQWIRENLYNPTLMEAAFTKAEPTRKVTPHVIKPNQPPETDLLRKREKERAFKVRTANESMLGQRKDPTEPKK